MLSVAYNTAKLHHPVKWATQNTLLVQTLVMVTGHLLSWINAVSKIHLISEGLHMDEKVYCSVNGNLFSTWINKYFSAQK